MSVHCQQTCRDSSRYMIMKFWHSSTNTSLLTSHVFCHKTNSPTNSGTVLYNFQSGAHPWDRDNTSFLACMAWNSGCWFFSSAAILFLSFKLLKLTPVRACLDWRKVIGIYGGIGSFGKESMCASGIKEGRISFWRKRKAYVRFGIKENIIPFWRKQRIWPSFHRNKKLHSRRFLD